MPEPGDGRCRVADHAPVHRRADLAGPQAQHHPAGVVERPRPGVRAIEGEHPVLVRCEVAEPAIVQDAGTVRKPCPVAGPGRNVGAAADDDGAIEAARRSGPLPGDLRRVAAGRAVHRGVVLGIGRRAVERDEVRRVGAVVVHDEVRRLHPDLVRSEPHGLGAARVGRERPARAVPAGDAEAVRVRSAQVHLGDREKPAGAVRERDRLGRRERARVVGPLEQDRGRDECDRRGRRGAGETARCPDRCWRRSSPGSWRSCCLAS